MNADSQRNLVYQAFHRICSCGSSQDSSTDLEWKFEWRAAASSHTPQISATRSHLHTYIQARASARDCAQMQAHARARRGERGRRENKSPRIRETLHNIRVHFPSRYAKCNTAVLGVPMRPEIWGAQLLQEAVTLNTKMNIYARASTKDCAHVRTHVHAREGEEESTYALEHLRLFTDEIWRYFISGYRPRNSNPGFRGNQRYNYQLRHGGCIKRVSSAYQALDTASVAYPLPQARIKRLIQPPWRNW